MADLATPQSPAGTTGSNTLDRRLFLLSLPAVTLLVSGCEKDKTSGQPYSTLKEVEYPAKEVEKRKQQLEALKKPLFDQVESFNRLLGRLEAGKPVPREAIVEAVGALTKSREAIRAIIHEPNFAAIHQQLSKVLFDTTQLLDTVSTDLVAESTNLEFWPEFRVRRDAVNELYQVIVYDLETLSTKGLTVQSKGLFSSDLKPVRSRLP